MRLTPIRLPRVCDNSRYLSSSSSSWSCMVHPRLAAPVRPLGGSVASSWSTTSSPIVTALVGNPHHRQHLQNTHHNTNDGCRRAFGSGGGSRGARGHGWWVNYRAGKGGRHLQGEYSHVDVAAMEAWNDAVLSLGSKLVYLDVSTEAMSSSSSSSSSLGESGSDLNSGGGGDDDDGKGQIHRLTIQLATAVLPKATDNFIRLLQADAGVGYATSTLHRVEKQVGLMGGLVWGGDGPNASRKRGSTPIGRCHPDLTMPTSLTSMDVKAEALVLSHLPGVVTMLMPRVHEVDSRFLMCSHHAPHLDGKAVAIGRLADESSLATVRQWEGSLITQMGRPTNVTLRIVGCGLLEDNDDNEANRVSTATTSQSAGGENTDGTGQKILSES